MVGMPRAEDRFRIERELGRGGFGVVHLARDADGTPVALKVHDRWPVEALRPRVEREARLLRDLRHPRLARFFGAFEAGEGGLALAYEYIEGHPLEQELRPEGLTVPRVQAWVEDVAGALGALHEAGLVHRDVKPANVMVDPRGHAVLLDFGLTRPEVAGETVTETGSILGTPVYMAPEQITGGRIGRAADIYALACMSFELLAGRPPFQGTPMEMADAHLSRPPPPLRRLRPEVPEETAAAVAWGLAKAPEARPDSAARFAAAWRDEPPPGPGKDDADPTLVLHSRGPPREAGPAEPPDPLVRTLPDRPPPRRGPWLVGALGLLLVAGILLGSRGGLATTRPPPSPAPPPPEPTWRQGLPKLPRLRRAWREDPAPGFEVGLASLPFPLPGGPMALSCRGNLLRVSPADAGPTLETPLVVAGAGVADSALVAPAADGGAWILAVRGAGGHRIGGTVLLHGGAGSPPEFTARPWPGAGYVEIDAYPPSTDGRLYAAVCTLLGGVPRSELVIALDGAAPRTVEVPLAAGSDAEFMAPFPFLGGWVLAISDTGEDPVRGSSRSTILGLDGQGAVRFRLDLEQEGLGPPAPAWGGLVLPRQRHLSFLHARHLTPGAPAGGLEEHLEEIFELPRGPLGATTRWEARCGTLFSSRRHLELVLRPSWGDPRDATPAAATWLRFSLEDPTREPHQATIPLLSEMISLGNARFTGAVMTPDGRAAALGFQNDAQQAAAALLDLEAGETVACRLLLGNEGITGGSLRRSPALLDLGPGVGVLAYFHVAGHLGRATDSEDRPQHLIEWFHPLGAEPQDRATLDEGGPRVREDI